VNEELKGRRKDQKGMGAPASLKDVRTVWDTEEKSAGEFEGKVPERGKEGASASPRKGQEESLGERERAGLQKITKKRSRRNR